MTVNSPRSRHLIHPSPVRFADMPGGAEDNTQGATVRRTVESNEADAKVSVAASSRRSRLFGPGRRPLRPGRRPLRRSTRIGVPTVAGLAVLAGLLFSGHWLLYSRNYVTTDNAQIDGDQIEINSPAAGRLQDWRVSQGSTVYAHEILGRVQLTGSGAQPKRPIRAPGTGTIALNAAVSGEQVDTATPLAAIYDLSRLYATARVKETDIADVHAGAPVQIDVDSYPNTSVSGVVEHIQASTSGQVALFPENNSSASFQKLTQFVPVKIALTDTEGLRLVPGMSITVHIATQ